MSKEKKAPSFKVGDRVRVNAEYPDDDIRGLTGVIRETCVHDHPANGIAYGIQFDGVSDWLSASDIEYAAAVEIA